MKVDLCLGEEGSFFRLWDRGVMLTPRHYSGTTPACGSSCESLFALRDARATIMKKDKLCSGASSMHDRG